MPNLKAFRRCPTRLSACSQRLRAWHNNGMRGFAALIYSAHAAARTEAQLLHDALTCSSPHRLTILRGDNGCPLFNHCTALNLILSAMRFAVCGGALRQWYSRCRERCYKPFGARCAASDRCCFCVARFHIDGKAKQTIRIKPRFDRRVIHRRQRTTAAGNFAKTLRYAGWTPVKFRFFRHRERKQRRQIRLRQRLHVAADI